MLWVHNFNVVVRDDTANYKVRPGIPDAALQNRLLSSKRRCCTANSFPEQLQHFIVRESGEFPSMSGNMNPGILVISGPLEGSNLP